jgi:hypothetical protein
MLTNRNVTRVSWRWACVVGLLLFSIVGCGDQDIAGGAGGNGGRGGTAGVGGAAGGGGMGGVTGTGGVGGEAGGSDPSCGLRPDRGLRDNGIGGGPVRIGETISTKVDQQWGEPELIQITGADYTVDPQIAFNSSGEAFAAWSQSDGFRYHIRINHFTPEIGWGVAERVETQDENRGDAVDPQVGISSDGATFVVWSQWDGARFNVWATDGYRAQRLNADDVGDAVKPQVAVHPNGQAVAVWSQRDGTRSDIWASNLQFGSFGERYWGSAARIESDDAADAVNPQIAFDLSGHAIAVWSQSDGTRFNLWANRFAPDTGWSVAERIETDDAADAIDPQIAIDANGPNGQALVVWSQSDATRFNIWANRFAPDTGWGVAERIETDNAGNTSDPRVSIGTNGQALVVWSQSDGTRFNIWANRFAPDTGWGVAERIETDNAGNASNPRVSIGTDGQAVAVWSQFDGTRLNAWTNRFTTNAGWGVPERIETDDAGNAVDPEVAVDSSGQALAVWSQWDRAGGHIWSNHYTPASGWGGADRIGSDDVYGSDPQVAIDSNGNALAVWSNGPGAIYANRSTTTMGWGVAEPIGVGVYPQVTFDATGRALAIWANAPDSICASRFTPSMGWGPAKRIGSGDLYGTQLAANPDGQALAVWSRSNYDRSSIWTNRFTPDAGWGVAEQIATDVRVLATFRVAVDARGNALAVWERLSERPQGPWRSHVWSRRFVPDAGWGAAERIDIDEDNATQPDAVQIAVGPSGDAVAVWRISSGERGSVGSIWSNRFTAGVGWGVAERIAIATASAYNPHVAIDLNGRALVIWQQAEGESTGDGIWSTRFTPSIGWGIAEQIVSFVGRYQIAVDPSSRAVVVWEQWDGTRYGLWSNRFIPDGGWSSAERIAADALGPQIAIASGGHAVAVWNQSDPMRPGVWASRFE